MLRHSHISDMEVGTDEAGRGSLAGPVTAAAVILPKNFYAPFLNDSKKVSKKQRYALRPVIEQEAISYSVAHIYPKTIDKINILNASILAMHKAIKKLSVLPKHILVDGNQFKAYKDIPHLCIVKGDSKYMNIAAASILAKTYRDDLMKTLHEEFPQYLWSSNKGYPTKAHRSAIKDFGITPYHRKSFNLLSTQLSLDF